MFKQIDLNVWKDKAIKFDPYFWLISEPEVGIKLYKLAMYIAKSFQNTAPCFIIFYCSDHRAWNNIFVLSGQVA